MSARHNVFCEPLGLLKISERNAEERLNTLPFINRRLRELMPQDFGLMADGTVDRIHENGLL